MERSLRNRLTFGPLMLLALFLLLVFDHNAQGWTRAWMKSHFHVDAGVGGLGLLVLLSVIMPIAVREVGVLFAAEHVRPFRMIAAIGCGALILHAFLTQFPPFQPIAASSLAFIVVSIPLLAALRRAVMKQTQEAITAMAGTVLSVLYLGGLGWFLMALRVKQSSHGEFHGTTSILLDILLMVKSTDIGAYFGGRAFGRRKLIPWLSPGKTWEGLVIGLLTAGLVGMAFTPAIEHAGWQAQPARTLTRNFIFGVVIGGIGQLGDLLESLMKRDAEVKDSGKLIPGFGGILDIIDSPLLASPVAYLLFSLFS